MPTNDPRAAIQTTDGYEWFTEFDDTYPALAATWQTIRAELAASALATIEPGACGVRLALITDPAADAYALTPGQFTTVETLDIPEDAAENAAR